EFNPNPETIATLLRSGAKVDEQDNGGMTALMWAAQTNSYLQTRNPKVITILLQAGANADLRSRVDKTALDYARGNKQLKDTKEFAALAKCSSGNASYVPGYQISMRLIGAAREGTTADVQALLAGGAPVDAEVEYEDGMTPLMAAAKDNADPAVIKILLKAGAKIDGQDKEGRTALMLAARWNPNPEATSTLLRAGADANVKSTYGKTAVEFAASNEKLIG